MSGYSEDYIKEKIIKVKKTKSYIFIKLSYIKIEITKATILITDIIVSTQSSHKA